MSERPNTGQKGHNQAWKAKTRPKGTKGDKRAISSHVSLFSQTHAWVSRVASHATALNIRIIIFIQCNHSSRFHTSLLNTQVVFRAQKTHQSAITYISSRNVVALVEEKQYKCGGGGGRKTIEIWWWWWGKTIEMWRWWWRENNRNVMALFLLWNFIPPPPHFYCFPCITTATTATFLLFFFHHRHHYRHISIVFPPPPPPPPPHLYCFSPTSVTTFLEEMYVISDWWVFCARNTTCVFKRDVWNLKLWLHWIKMMILMLRAVAWLATRDTHACVWENKDTWLEMARLSPFVPFGLVLAFQAWLWPFWPVFGLSDTI